MFQVAAAVVTLMCGSNVGSATILSDGHYVTAAHVVQDQTCDLGRIIYIDHAKDIAIGRTTPETRIPSTVTAACEIITSEIEYTLVGYPNVQRQTVRQLHYGQDRARTIRANGITKIYENPDNGALFSGIQTTGAASGMSGGGVFNPQGQLVGVIDAAYPEEDILLIQTMANTPVCGG